MAGRGPAPKRGRRRSNSPLRGDWVDLPALEVAVLADLPLDEAWPDSTLEMWSAWQLDPATSQWSATDVQLALDTIRLHAKSPVAKATEIRLRMDALGLTLKGKRDLRWRVQAPAVAAAKAAAAKPRPAEARRLRAVDAA